MTTVTIREAKANLSMLLRKVAAGEEVVITRGKKPVARLVAIGEVKGKRQPGSLKGTLHVGLEFLSICANANYLAGSSPLGVVNLRYRSAACSLLSRSCSITD
jgi:prevent-host-death family protein